MLISSREAHLKKSVEARANLLRSDLKMRAEDLDARNHGSTFAQELASYGKYFVLILGPFANFIITIPDI